MINIKVYSYLTVVEDDKMTKEEYDDMVFESYALDDEKDTKVEEEVADNVEDDEEKDEKEEKYNFFHKISSC